MPFTGKIHAGWIIDGTGKRPIRSGVMELRQGILSHIRPAENITAAEEGTLDFSDATVLPGLVDAHVHLGLPASGTDVKEALTADAIAANEKRYLACGVVALRDAGERSGILLAYRDRERDSETGPGLHIRLAGPALHCRGRYGRFVGTALAAPQYLPEIAAGLAERVDHIKIMNSGLNSLIHYGKETPCQFSEAQLAAAVSISHRFSRQVMVHANGRLPVQTAVAAGCDSIEHGYFMGADNLKRMRDRQVTWVPTAIPMAAHIQRLAPESREAYVARKTLDHQLEQIAQARRLGVRVAAGTDAGSPGVPHGAGLIEELKLLRMAGFSAEEFICCAAANGARLLDCNVTGRLVLGVPATFSIVPGPPASLPESLNSIRCRFSGGRMIEDCSNYKRREHRE